MTDPFGPMFTEQRASEMGRPSLLGRNEQRVALRAAVSLIPFEVGVCDVQLKTRSVIAVECGRQKSDAASAETSDIAREGRSHDRHSDDVVCVESPSPAENSRRTILRRPRGLRFVSAELLFAVCSVVAKIRKANSRRGSQSMIVHVDRPASQIRIVVREGRAADHKSSVFQKERPTHRSSVPKKCTEPKSEDRSRTGCLCTFSSSHSCSPDSLSSIAISIEGDVRERHISPIGSPAVPPVHQHSRISTAVRDGEGTDAHAALSEHKRP